MSKIDEVIEEEYLTAYGIICDAYEHREGGMIWSALLDMKNNIKRRLHEELAEIPDADIKRYEEVYPFLAKLKHRPPCAFNGERHQYDCPNQVEYEGWDGTITTHHRIQVCTKHIYLLRGGTSYDVKGTEDPERGDGQRT
jgi:hypothetical protein